MTDDLVDTLARATSKDRGVRIAALRVLTQSTDDRALEVLLEQALIGRWESALLGQAVHPAMTPRLRAVLAASNLALLEEFDPKEHDTPRTRGMNAIVALGARNDVESVDTIATLLTRHPMTRVQTACALALAELRDPRAYAIVDAGLQGGPNEVQFLRSAIFRDLTTAYDRFATAEPALLSRVLFQIRGNTIPRKLDPDPLVVDPRWIDLAASRRRDPYVGGAARAVLSALPREVQHAAIARHPISIAPNAPAIIPSPRDWIARYRAGEHAVWREVSRHADAVAQHSDLRAEALALATEIMQRVRANRDAVRATLIASGAQLGPEAPPATDADLARLIAITGPLPIAIEAFYRTVGSILLVPGGAAPDRYHYGPSTLEADGISLIALDPLESSPVTDLDHQLDDYTHRCAESHPDVVGPFRAEIAPDFLHKQDISGGGPLAFDLPPADPVEAIDPWLLHDHFDTRFVPYLRHAFKFGGFPLLQVASWPRDKISLNFRIAFENVSGGWAAAADTLLARLRADLVDF